MRFDIRRELSWQRQRKLLTARYGCIRQFGKQEIETLLSLYVGRPDLPQYLRDKQIYEFQIAYNTIGYISETDHVAFTPLNRNALWRRYERFQSDKSYKEKSDPMMEYFPRCIIP